MMFISLNLRVLVSFAQVAFA